MFTYTHNVSYTYIYIGAKQHAKNLKCLKSLGITHILNCTPPRTIDPENGCPNYFEKDVNTNLTYKRIAIFDNRGEDVLNHMDATYK